MTAPSADLSLRPRRQSLAARLANTLHGLAHMITAPGRGSPDRHEDALSGPTLVSAAWPRPSEPPDAA